MTTDRYNRPIRPGQTVLYMGQVYTVQATTDNRILYVMRGEDRRRIHANECIVFHPTMI